MSPSVGRMPPSGTPCPLLPSSGQRRDCGDAEGLRPTGPGGEVGQRELSPLLTDWETQGLLRRASHAPHMKRQGVGLEKLVSRPISGPREGPISKDGVPTMTDVPRFPSTKEETQTKAVMCFSQGLGTESAFEPRALSQIQDRKSVV